MAAGIALPDLLWDDDALDGYGPDTRRERQPWRRLGRRDEFAGGVAQEEMGIAELVAGAGDGDAADFVCLEDEEAELDGDGEY